MDDTLPPPRRRSWPLILSVCLNVALVVFIAVAAGRIAHAVQGGPLGPRALMAEFPEAHDALQKVADAHAGKTRALREASRHARRDAFVLLTAPDYTPAKMSSAMAAVAAADAALETEIVASAADGLSALSPDQRRTLVDRIKRRHRFWLNRMMRGG